MAIRHGKAFWPGAIGVEACTYTLSHGISPGIAILKVQPQDAFPAETGDLVITDDLGTVTIPDCKVDSMTMEHGEGGRVWSLAIYDRRWKWKDLGQISGCYNQLDPLGKLIPWTIRSPEELAKLCLQAMGEARYSIDLPPGLTRADGIMHGQANPPHIGVIPTTGTNPPVNWVQEPPAQALANLCDTFGRKVIYCLKTNSVLIARPGIGGTLPNNFSVAHQAPSIDSPETPTGVAVAGSPTRYQAKFDMSEAVGEDYDGHLYPINQLSYAPQWAGKVQISKFTATVSAPGDFTLTVYLAAPPGFGPEFGVPFTSTKTGAVNANGALTDIATAINASQDVDIQGMKATVVGDAITIDGGFVGKTFSFWVDGSGDVTGEGSLTQAAQQPETTWEFSRPPQFMGVRATSNLSMEEARALAQKTVFRLYRLTMNAPNGNGPLKIPAYGGELVRRQQIRLEPTKVEQVTPQPLNPVVVNPNLTQIGAPQPGETTLASAHIDLYNGYSRDLPAVMTGGHAIHIARNSGHLFVTTNLGPYTNTFDTDRIFVPFSIDPYEQVVAFSDYVYYEYNGRIYPILHPVLETACTILNSETNSPECFAVSEVLPNMKGATNFAVRRYPDVQLNIIGKYNPDGSTNGGVALEADAHMRAQFYLEGLKLQYPVVAAETREYNGIVPIDCDGAISQVTWSVGPAGAATVASANTEHNVYIPPYRARRRAEFLAPPNLARLQAQDQNIRAGLFTPPDQLQ